MLPGSIVCIGWVHIFSSMGHNVWGAYCVSGIKLDLAQGKGSFHRKTVLYERKIFISRPYESFKVYMSRDRRFPTMR